MIPSTVVGLVILAATAAPGRIYERRAEQRAPRPQRSTTSEIVELIVIGEMATLAAVLVVLLVTQLTGTIDVGDLIDHPRRYAGDHPAPIVISSIGALALSYAAADAAARFFYPVSSPEERRQGGGFSPHSIWYDVLWESRPSRRHGAVATVELKNGFRITGVVASFTAEDADNRELALREPIAMKAPGGDAVRFEGGDFVLIREGAIRFIAGRYTFPG